MSIFIILLTIVSTTYFPLFSPSCISKMDLTSPCFVIKDLVFEEDCQYVTYSDENLILLIRNILAGEEQK